MYINSTYLLADFSVQIHVNSIEFSVYISAIWRLAKKIMGYLIILINGQTMMYFVSKNATFTNQSQFHNLVTQ